MRRAISLFPVPAALALFLAAAALPAALPAQTHSGVAARTISVTGTGEVEITVNEAVIPVMISTDGADVETAKREHEKVYKDVRALVARLGIPEGQVDIDYLDVSSQRQVTDEYAGIVQRYDKDGDDKRPKTIGYDASRQILITLKDLSKLEELQQGLVKMEDVSMGDMEFSGPDMDAQRDKARLLAVRNAREKAVAMAGELGAKVGKPVTISEFPSMGGGDGSFQSYMAMLMSMGAMAKGEAGNNSYTSFGQIPITVQVSVVFELE